MDLFDSCDHPVNYENVFAIDNNYIHMRDLLDFFLQSTAIDVCSAYIDPCGIAALGASQNDQQTIRLLIGHDLDDTPQEQDLVTFQMADEYEATGEDPVERQGNDEYINAAITAVEHPNFFVHQTPKKTHAKLFLSSQYGVVGSSNLTKPGLMNQTELNLMQSKPEAVAQLKAWYEQHWVNAENNEHCDYKTKLIKWLRDSRIMRYHPFHPYAKAIFEKYRHRFVNVADVATDIDLAVFQEEGRDVALHILAEHKCCIIADAVGLGKTFVGLGTMQRRARYLPRQERTILVICPAQLENVWKQAAKDQNISLETESMETLGQTQGSLSAERIAKLSNFKLVIVDEAHNFRNQNSKRFLNLMSVLQQGKLEKELLLLTATPINNSTDDLYSLYRLMTQDQDDFFMQRLSIRSLREFFQEVRKGARDTTELLLETMVCRSRQDIRKRQENGETIVINGKPVSFPKRTMVSVDYSLDVRGNSVDYAKIANTIENLVLAGYNVERYATNPDSRKGHTYERLQTLFRVLLLKRLESSIVSFISTAQQLLNFSDAVVDALKKGKTLSNDEFRGMGMNLLDYASDNEEDNPDSAYIADLKEHLSDDYDLLRIADDVQTDHAMLEPIISKLGTLVGNNDGKLARLKTLLKELLPDQKVLVFSFFSDTVDYLYEQLSHDTQFMADIKQARIEKITGTVDKTTKTRIVKKFAPLANNAASHSDDIQLLISTDVLSEGQNLQDCGYLINYDLHFNPVRMIQRNGRIDRLFSKHNSITIANFFPEGPLEEVLKIVNRLQHKIETIQQNMPVDSSVIGEEVRVFSLVELQRTQKGDVSIIDEIDAKNPINHFHDLLNEVVKMLQDFGIDEVSKIPYGCQSNKRSTHRGVFVCVAAGKLPEHNKCWWLYYKLDGDQPTLLPEPITDPSTIIDNIRSPRPDAHLRWEPEVSPRPIRWDILLNAKQYCRNDLLRTFHDQRLGQNWSQTHSNKKIMQRIANYPNLPDGLMRRLGRYSIDQYKAEVVEHLKIAKQTNDCTELIQWVDSILPADTKIIEDPSTMPLHVISYLELIPETEG